jgi:membrane associated rhomboid family serine protease
VIPLRDDVPSRIVPFVTFALIALNLVVFLFELSLGRRLEGLFSQAAVIPALYTGGDGRLGFGEALLTSIHPQLGLRVLSSMFLHGGVLHFVGNMLYLWIFGDNVEDRMGHMRFLFFYLICGWTASYAHIWAEASSQIPSIGASGAIAAVLAAYMVLFPRARIVTLIPLGFFSQVVRIPAFFFLAFWFLQQFLFGALSLSARTAETSGVAWWAHIGGFASGLALVGFLKRRKRHPRRRSV